MGKIVDKVKRTNLKLGIVLDSLKALVIVVVLFTLIVLFISSIVHNLLKAAEVSAGYEGEYKNLYPTSTGNSVMNLYVQGEGEKTIVILPSYKSASPVFEYKALADSLKSNYRVVIVEYLGYGYSTSTNEDRSSKNIVDETRQALMNAAVGGPYILIAFDSSNIYAEYYSQKFPDEIIGIVSIDGMYTEAITNKDYKDKYLPNLVNNVKFYSVLSNAGIFRWATYLKPESFNIDKMSVNKSYNEEDISLYRKTIAHKFLNKSMRHEAEKFQENMNELKDYKYPDNLETLQILTNDTIEEYEERNENVENYAKNLISNKNIQRIVKLDGKLNEYLYEKEMMNSLTTLLKVNF